MSMTWFLVTAETFQTFEAVGVRARQQSRTLVDLRAQNTVELQLTNVLGNGRLLLRYCHFLNRTTTTTT